MNRFQEIVSFIERDTADRHAIEHEARYAAIMERLHDVLSTVENKTIVKAGIGSGRMIKEIAGRYPSYITVVEPSMELIKKFSAEISAEDYKNRVRYINGDFQHLPVDYYAANIFICVDYLDLFDSSRCIDEFKIATQFNGIFFFAGVVLSDDDIDGIYDDFMRIISPLHNDYYLSQDFRTFIELKDFTFIKSSTVSFPRDLAAEIAYYQTAFPGISGDEANRFLGEHREDFNRLYAMDASGAIREPYFIGYFRRNMIERTGASIE